MCVYFLLIVILEQQLIKANEELCNFLSVMDNVFILSTSIMKNVLSNSRLKKANAFVFKADEGKM